MISIGACVGFFWVVPGVDAAVLAVGFSPSARPPVCLCELRGPPPPREEAGSVPGMVQMLSMERK